MFKFKGQCGTSPSDYHTIFKGVSRTWPFSLFPQQVLMACLLSSGLHFPQRRLSKFLLGLLPGSSQDALFFRERGFMDRGRSKQTNRTTTTTTTNKKPTTNKKITTTTDKTPAFHVCQISDVFSSKTCQGQQDDTVDKSRRPTSLAT